MKIVIASENPAKVKAVKSAFGKVFRGRKLVFKSLNVDSGVSPQPMTDKETLKGAENRSLAAAKSMNGDYFVGIEGGVEKKGDIYDSFAWISIRNVNGILGKSKTGIFILPAEISRLIESGIELGEATDIVFKASNSKKKGGTVGFLTKNLIDRSKYYEHALILALIPFMNKKLYFV